jgi:hypothetical protein
MTPNETLAAIAIKINEAESFAAQAGLALAEGEALSTEEFDAHFDAQMVKDTGQKLKHAQATVVKLKERLAVLHVSLNETAATADFPRPRSGK